MERQRFDTDVLDPVDPFELDDDNLSHLVKHGLANIGLHVGFDLLYEIYLFDEPLYYEAEPPADWLMVGEVQSSVLQVPLAAPRTGFPNKCRPIGLYQASHQTVTQYRDDLRRWR